MKTETTIRRAKNAVGLVLDGALRHIDDNDSGQEYADNVAALFEAVYDELHDWDINCPSDRCRHLVDDLEVLLASEPTPMASALCAELGVDVGVARAVAVALLARHDLLP